MNLITPEQLEFNTDLYVNHEGSVLGIPGFKGSIAPVAPFIGGWYGANTKETEDESMEIDFGGSNMAAVTFDGNGVVGYLSGQLLEMDDLFGNGPLQVFQTNGYVVNPDYRGMGIGSALFERVLGQCGAFYGDTRNFSVVRIAAKLAQERGGYMQFGYERHIPDWAIPYKDKFQELIEFLWSENLEYVAGDNEYRIPDKYKAMFPGMGEASTLFTYAPKWIKTGMQEIKESDPFMEMLLFLNQYPDLYSPMLYVKRPC